MATVVSEHSRRTLRRKIDSDLSISAPLTKTGVCCGFPECVGWILCVPPEKLASPSRPHFLGRLKSHHG